MTYDVITSFVDRYYVLFLITGFIINLLLLVWAIRSKRDDYDDYDY